MADASAAPDGPASDESNPQRNVTLLRLAAFSLRANLSKVLSSELLSIVREACADGLVPQVVPQSRDTLYSRALPPTEDLLTEEPGFPWTSVRTALQSMLDELGNHLIHTQPSDVPEPAPYLVSDPTTASFWRALESIFRHEQRQHNGALIMVGVAISHDGIDLKTAHPDLGPLYISIVNIDPKWAQSRRNRRLLGISGPGVHPCDLLTKLVQDLETMRVHPLIWREQQVRLFLVANTGDIVGNTKLLRERKKVLGKSQKDWSDCVLLTPSAPLRSGWTQRTGALQAVLDVRGIESAWHYLGPGCSWVHTRVAAFEQS